MKSNSKFSSLDTFQNFEPKPSRIGRARLILGSHHSRVIYVIKISLLLSVQSLDNSNKIITDVFSVSLIMEANQGGEKWQNGLCSWSHIDNTRNCKETYLISKEKYQNYK